MKTLDQRDIIAAVLFASPANDQTLDQCFDEAETLLEHSLKRDQARGVRPPGEKLPWQS